MSSFLISVLEFIEILSITVPLAIGGVLSARIMLNRPKKVDKYTKKLDASREIYIEELEDDLATAKHQLSARERGPKVEGEIGQLSELLPDLLGSFESFVPRWLKPIIANKEIQGTLIKKIQEEPEKFANLFGKLIGKKTTEQGSSDKIADSL